MRGTMPILVASAMLLSAGALQAKTNRDPEAQLVKIIAARRAGNPTNCIDQHQIASLQIISRTAIVYRMNNGTIYVNRPTSGASSLQRDDVLVTDTHSPRLCNVDIVKLYDNSSHMTNGSVGLGKFVPYPSPPLGK